MNENVKIIYKNINELKPYEKNPRINDEAVPYVAESIKKFGFKVPIVIDKNNVVINGHTRLKASKKLGIKAVPCIMADDLTDEQVKAFRLADNKVAEFAQWDWNLLDGELEELEEMNFDMEDFGFEFNEHMDGSEEEYENPAMKTIYQANLDKYDEEKTDGEWQIPIIKNEFI